ncbi:MAG: DNA-processing protein DprA [Vicinamibacterales bacterium]
MPPSLDLIALALLPVWRWRTVTLHLRDGLPAADILQAQCADARNRRRPPTWADPARALALASAARARSEAAGLALIGQDDPAFPPALLEIPDPPPVLWVAGQVSALSTPAVALVGSRAGSSYAVAVAERLAAELAASGVTVVSGLARGVDAAAHAGALAAEGATVGVLGCGADVVYPPEHRALASQMTTRGAVVSELVPGTVPQPGFFPRRNRIISGLSRAVVVIEAGEKSGSLITARCALEQGRDVMAVPGNVLGGRNRGGHALLRDGARLVESAADVLDELGWTARAGVGTVGVAPRHAPDPVLDALTVGEPSDLGDISARCGLGASDLLPRLLDLEFRGLVRREPGGRFVRFDRTC